MKYKRIEEKRPEIDEKKKNSRKRGKKGEKKGKKEIFFVKLRHEQKLPLVLRRTPAETAFVPAADGPEQI